MNIYYDELEKTLKRIEDKVNRVVAKLKVGNSINPKNIFFDNQEFIQIMNISKRTAQTWRDEGRISFSQVGSKIYYRMSDVQKLLDTHYRKANPCIKSNNPTKTI